MDDFYSEGAHVANIEPVAIHDVKLAELASSESDSHVETDD